MCIFFHFSRIMPYTHVHIRAHTRTHTYCKIHQKWQTIYKTGKKPGFCNLFFLPNPIPWLGVYPFTATTAQVHTTKLGLYGLKWVVVGLKWVAFLKMAKTRKFSLPLLTNFIIIYNKHTQTYTHTTHNTYHTDTQTPNTPYRHTNTKHTIQTHKHTI